MRRLAAVLLLALSTQAALAIGPLPFRDDAEQERFQRLVAELRCTVCQNQNLADSNAELAKDLRQRVFEMLQQGRSDAEIKQFLVERYGDFVLYRPPVKPQTWLLWFGPALVVLAGAGLVVTSVRRRARALPADAQGIEDSP
ncbi:MAG: cytochrome c-type biogenesis protein [Pseudomonadota bacterium]|jgi:cytochrome c-type biogenesis protein CcmH